VTADDGITQYTLTYTAGAGGTISGTTPQTVNAGGSGTAVTAAPDAASSSWSWSDGGDREPAHRHQCACKPFSVTANFQRLGLEMISVAAGSFDMGRTSSGDDATYGGCNELPVHTVALSAYKIGKYEVTNQQYCDVLNYAIDSSRNYLRTSGNARVGGSGDIYAGADLQRIVAVLER
jgi:formylglycine-generating enzyme required for sulfatase activity